jgi:chemotaxis family two-component system response regulator Rcp1
VLKSPTMLLVEDSPSDVRLIREALKSATGNVQMVVAHDGVEAINYLRRCQSAMNGAPDLILLDLNLPRKSGHEVLAELKSDPDLKTIPVLVMTSSDDESDIEQAYNLNANCYIRKPGNFPEYERVVQAIEDFWLCTVTLPHSYSFYSDRAFFQAPSEALQ